MPPLPGFTSNPLQTRCDLAQAASVLLSPLQACQSSKKARIRLPSQTGAGFDEVSAQLEGFARPLLAIAPLLLHSNDSNDSTGLLKWLDGFAAGVDPASEEYWGDIGDVDQRMVETESIALLLLFNPTIVRERLGDEVLRNLTAWLRGTHHKRMPVSNWRWFRIFVNLALVKVLGVPESEVKEELDQDLAILDSFYMGEGWNSDGPWGEQASQADYYSGSFAIQFSQLLFVYFVDHEAHRERVERYKEQARDFAAKFWRFFDRDGKTLLLLSHSGFIYVIVRLTHPSCCAGAGIPFGRSMTYRFAFAAFWAAAALVKVGLEPYLNLGEVKGLLLRHLRWWADEERSGIFHSDGSLTIGYTYPNMYLTEDYNSPQSPYWCLKSFLILALPETDDFWKSKEEGHPIERLQNPLESTLLDQPKQIVVNDPAHHYLLSAGQFTSKTFKAREAKYCKFAYSSSVGFSVPAGTLLHQMAPDSTLAVRFAHDEFWRTRSHPCHVRVTKVKSNRADIEVSCLTSTWTPWKHRSSFKIETTLIPPYNNELSGWHIRLHRLSGWDEATSSDDEVELMDAGFAIPCLSSTGRFLTTLKHDSNGQRGWTDSAKDAPNTFITSKSGASGVLDLTTALGFSGQTRANRDALTRSQADVLRTDPNTNLIFTRTVVPFVKHTISLRNNSQTDLYLVTAVFCVKPTSDLTPKEIDQLWRRQPSLTLDSNGVLEVGLEKSQP